MTREDAILCLKGMKNYARDTFTEQTDWQTSLDMAIKALEREQYILDAIAIPKGSLTYTIDGKWIVSKGAFIG